MVSIIWYEELRLLAQLYHGRGFEPFFSFIFLPEPAFLICWVPATQRNNLTLKQIPNYLDILGPISSWVSQLV